jgi:hypothetical protein
MFAKGLMVMYFFLYSWPLLFFNLLVSSVFAQTINFNATGFDFGDVRQGEKVIHDFNFTNSGSSDLIIRKINSSCGCIAAVSDNATIPPGSQSSIRATFDTTGFYGKKLKTIRIYSNDSSNSSVILKLGAKVVPEIHPIPEKLELMNIKKDEGSSVVVNFEKPWGTDPKVTEVISKSQYLTVSYDKSNGSIIVKVDPKSPIGLVQSRISVKTDSKNVPVLNIPVTFEVLGNLDIQPKNLNLGLIDSNKPFPIRRIKITRRDGGDIEDISVSNESRAITVDVERQSDSKSVNLLVGVVDKTVPIVRGAFKFKIQDDETEYSVPFYGVMDGL